MSGNSPSELLKSRFPNAVIASHHYRGDETVTVRKENLLEIAQALKEDPAFQMSFLMDLSAVDYLTFGSQPQAKGAFVSSGIALKQPMNIPDEEPWAGPHQRAGTSSAAGTVPPRSPEPRFEVVYHFFSLPLKSRIRVKVPVEESDPMVASLTPLWASANWFEREVWDMYGIRFRGHPDLKRILMYEEFVGHPLRKDYPVNKRQPLIGPVN